MHKVSRLLAYIARGQCAQQQSCMRWGLGLGLNADTNCTGRRCKTCAHNDSGNYREDDHDATDDDGLESRVERLQIPHPFCCHKCFHISRTPAWNKATL